MSGLKLKNRIFYFDELRALAILFVILMHVSKWFVKNESANSLYWMFSSSLSSLGNIGVPLFMMISGALLLNRKYELATFFKKRFLRIFSPFLFWVIFIIMFRIVLFKQGFEDIINIVFFDGFVWFVWTLCGIYLFIPIVNSYINEYKLKGAQYFLIIWAVTIILNTLGIYPIENIELRYFSGFLGYLIIGWYLSNKNINLNKYIWGLIFLASTAIHIFLVLNGVKFENIYLTAIPVIQSASIYLLIKNWEFTPNKSVLKAVTSISICSYGMYLTHYFLIWSLMRTNFITHIFNQNPFIWVWIVFVATVLFSWILILICSRMPYIKKVCGV